MYYYADDQYIWTDERKQLTSEQLAIPGLHMMGYGDFRSATAGMDATPHYHHTMEFVVFLDGTQQYSVENKIYTLYGGDIFMTYPDEPHGGEALPQKVSEFIWFQFNLSLSSAENFLGLAAPYSQYIFNQIPNYRYRVKKAQPKDLKHLRDIFFLLASAEPQQHLLGYSYFLQFIVNNLCSPDFPPKSETCSTDILDGTSYIHAHLHENLSIELIAKQCGLSPDRFKVKFKEQMGITPHTYILSLKVDTAKILLVDPENTITDIAYRLNFSSSNHFANVFKKFTGYTPSEYRRVRAVTPY